MRHAATVLAAVALTALPGCLVTSSSATSYTGARVEPSQVGAIVLHRTTPEEAIAALGEPTERTATPDGDEVLTWRWTRESASSGAVFLIFGGSNKTVHRQAFHITFRDGVAVRKWRS